MASAYPSYDRLVIALLIGATLIAVATVRPRAAIVATMAFLPVLGLVRRLLIADAGWSSADPLLLVAPCVAGVLLIRRLFATRKVPGDLLSRLVLALLVLTVLEVANPSGSGITANATALLFVAAPLGWFFVGRELADGQTIRLVLGVTVAAAVAIAIYGLSQTATGLPPWDQSWVAVASGSGYAALSVGGQVRAFGTFASAAEYGTYLGVALMICLAMVSARRIWLICLAPLLLIAIAYASSRSVVVLSLLAAIILAAARTGNARLMVGIIAIGMAAAIGAYSVFGHQLAVNATVTGNALLRHQVAGLTDPLNPNESTLFVHWQQVVNGITGSTLHPLGLGPGATIATGTASAAGAASTEVDATNAFVGLGIPGGILYLAIIGLVVWRTGRLALRTRDATVLCVLGILIVALGEWLNGGFYAVAPLLWLSIGFVGREWEAARVSRGAAVSAATSSRGDALATSPMA